MRLTNRAVLTWLSVTAAAAVLAGCGNGSVSPTLGDIPAPASLEGVRWEPIAATGDRAHGAYLAFDGPLSWHGSDGCTEVRGSYQYFAKSDGRVVARAAEQDLRGLQDREPCSGVPTASALQSAAFLRVDKGHLLLVSEHDQVILRLAPAADS
jgi:hypothetical protein